MNFFNKDKSHASKCACHNNGLCLNKQQTSRMVALCLVVVLFIFIGGYFWGQHTAVAQLLNSIERDSFADQIHYSMCSLYDQKDEESTEAEAATADEDAEEQKEVTESEDAQPQEREPEMPIAKGQKKYCALLAGFGSEKSARQLATRLDKRGFRVEVKKRNSRSTKGKIVPWYQVVTHEYASRKELDFAILTMKRHEKLHDIRVVECA